MRKEVENGMRLKLRRACYPRRHALRKLRGVPPERRTCLMPLSFSRPRLIDIIAWVLLAAAMIFAIYVRVRLREFPLERDEGEFAYAGQLLLQGVPPYKLAYNMKLPGTYIAYAALMAVFGQTTAGIHLGLLAREPGDDLIALSVGARDVRSAFGRTGGRVLCDAFDQPRGSRHGRSRHALRRLFRLAGVYLLWRWLQSR